MEYRQPGGSGFKVAALSLGTGTFGGSNEFFRSWGASDVADTTRLLQRPSVCSAAFGASNEAQLRQSLGAVGGQLAAARIARPPRARRRRRIHAGASAVFPELTPVPV